MNYLISKEFIECCPKCGNSACVLINREYVIATSSYRKISHAELIEIISCDACKTTWSDTYNFLHGHRGDWMFAVPILKCPICGGDTFEMERCGRGTKDGQSLQFRCIDNDDFVWGEEYLFSHAVVPEM